MSLNKILFFLTLYLLLINTSCKKSSTEITDIESIMIDDCFVFMDDEMVIDNSESYNKLLLDSLYSHEDTCPDYQLPHIDFEERTLLRKVTRISACEAGYGYVVTACAKDEEYICTINITHSGECDTTLTKQNWISVPKLPEGYEVKFDVQY